ncbi:MAG: hypothetical protein NC429_14585 [Lachnospiraceae bacterium]|nr:hypothetical protein [Lachnospiraceae bacterium]
MKKDWIRPSSCLSAKNRLEALSMSGRGQELSMAAEKFMLLVKSNLKRYGNFGG